MLSDREDEPTSIDDWLRGVGDFGPYQRRHFAIYGLVDDMRAEAGRGDVRCIETWIELEARVFRLPGGPNHRFVEHRLTSHELLGLIS